MRFTYNWLKDFVEVKIPAQKLADKLTMAGLEVKSLQEKEGDFVFEIEITSNRPDWLSVIGIAREVAAITGTKLRLPGLVNSQQSTVHSSKSKGKIYGLSTMDYRPISIAIEDTKDCPLYTAKLIKDVRVAPSPEWLRKRLELIGCRSINNIVDITNYIMFTYGEPLHAFDLDKLNSDKIIIRRAKTDEKLVVIDGQEKILDSEILVIANTSKPIAVAGVMGGKDTEVSQTTKNVLLEAAIFNMVVIRQGRRKLGMQSESSYRFERGIDYQTAEFASEQAVKLIEELTGARCVLAEAEGLNKPKTIRINLNLANARSLLNINIKDAQTKAILKSLGFAVKVKPKGNYLVEVPLLRQDVKSEIDLIEEVARIYGFENIPQTLPAVRPQISGYIDRDKVSLIKDILAGLGLSEVITYSLISKDSLEGLPQDNLVEIRNPLSQEQEILRPAIAPGLLKVIAHNLNQKQAYVNIFEIAKAFSGLNKQTPEEELVLAIGLCGIRPLFLNQGQIKDEPGLLHLKGIISAVFERLGIEDFKFNLTPEVRVEVYLDKEKIGQAYRVKRDILEKFEIKNKEVFISEIYLKKILEGINLNKKFMPWPVYPAISRDISLVIKETDSVEKLMEEIKNNAGQLLKEIKVVDYYRGKQIHAGFRGLTLSCIYRSDEKTLTEEEINVPHSAILDIIKNKFGAELR